MKMHKEISLIFEALGQKVQWKGKQECFLQGNNILSQSRVCGREDKEIAEYEN